MVRRAGRSTDMESARRTGRKESFMRYVRTLALVLILALATATGAAAIGPQLTPNGVAGR